MYGWFERGEDGSYGLTSQGAGRSSRNTRRSLPATRGSSASVPEKKKGDLTGPLSLFETRPAQFAFTSMVFGFAAGTFGKERCRTPFLNSAPIFSLSTSSGRTKLRQKQAERLSLMR